jgi:hypothetical protein
VKPIRVFHIVSTQVVLGLLAVLCCLPAFSQSATGKVTGIITDTSGAVISGANVAVTNVATGAKSTVVSGADGSYEVLQLPVGSYTVKVQKDLFETTITAPSELEINQTVRVDVRLAVGTVAQVVSVDSQAAQVETENPTIGSTITGPAVQELPLNGRDPMSLLQTQPGVSGSFTTNSNGGSIAGGRTDNVSFLLDGGNNNVVRSSALNFDPNPDTVAEFRVLMNNYTAEYGRSGGGVVSVVTKSGTNELHGSLFEYLRNTDFDANNFFLNQTGQPRAILQRNQYGGTAGGPVMIPKLFNGKDKLFFFFAYQGQKQNQTSVGSVATVYTPGEIQGNFSAANNGKPDPDVVAFLQTYPFFQPNASLAAQGIIAPGTINPIFQNFVKANLIVNNSSGSYVPTQATKTNYNQYSTKIDYLITATDRLTGTYGFQSNPTLNAGNIGFPLDSTATNSFVTLDYTKTIGPSLINDLRGSATREHQNQNNPTTTTPGPQALGINITPDLDLGTPQISMPSGYLSLGYNPNNSDLADTTFNYADTITWIRGAHTFKAGFSFIAEQENSDYNYDTMGEFDFYGASTSIGSGNPLADFEFGLPDAFAQYPSAFSNMRSKIYAGFGQDEWKVAPRLQLTIGLRYEYGSPQLDTLGRSFSLIPGEQSQRFVAAPVGAVFPGDPGAPKGLYFPDKNNFAPRFGLAWDPFGDGKTSVRAGFGVFYNILNGWAQDENNGIPPFYAGVTFSNNDGDPLSRVSAAPQYLSNPYSSNGQINPFPSHATLSSNDPNLFLNLSALPFGTEAWFADTHLRTPYIYNYNLSVERQLVKNLALDVSYVGSSSHKLTNMEDGNPIILGTNVRILNAERYPYFNDPNRGLTDNGFGPLPSVITNDGAASYNGLLASLTKRFSQNRYIGTTFFTAAYTWSHNIDNGTGSLTSTSGNIPYYDHDALRGNSALDQRQRFTLAGGWELPFAQAWSSGPKRLTEGWTLLPIFSDFSGAPFDISAGLRESSVGNKPGPSGAGDLQLVRAELTTSSVQRYNPHSTRSIGSQTGLYYFNPNDFTVPSAWNSTSFIPTGGLTYGMGRDSIPGIGEVNLDMALTKRTALFRDRVNSEFRLEAFNSLNHTEFANPNTSRTSGLFGQVTSVRGNRVGQIALRIQF